MGVLLRDGLSCFLIPNAELSPIEVAEVVWDVPFCITDSIVENHTLRDHNAVAFRYFYRLIILRPVLVKDGFHK